MVLPHETTHVMKQRSYKTYTDFIQQTPLLLNLQGKASLKLLDMAASHRGIDLNDIDEAQFINLYDELNAIVYGMCKGGILENRQYDYGAWIPNAFNNFEGYIQELDRIHEQFRSQSGRLSGTLESAVAQYDEVNALLDPGVQRQLLEFADRAALTGGQQLALDVYNRRMGEIASLQTQLREQQDILAKMQRQGASALQQIPTKNRIKLLTHKLAREQKDLLSLESAPGMQQLLEKLRQSQAPETSQVPEIPDSSKSVETIFQKDVENIRTYVRINTDGNIITDGSHIENGKLRPNVTYQTGEHAYLYATNAEGLVIKVHADELKEKTHKGRLKHNPKTYGKKAGDHAGHLIGDRFGGSPELDNLVSQAALVNQSKYYKIEKQWAAAIKAGMKVSVDITVNYDGGTRPTSFVVEYTIDGRQYKSDISNN